MADTTPFLDLVRKLDQAGFPDSEESRILYFAAGDLEETSTKPGKYGGSTGEVISSTGLPVSGDWESNGGRMVSVALFFEPPSPCEVHEQLAAGLAEYFEGKPTVIAGSELKWIKGTTGYSLFLAEDEGIDLIIYNVDILR